jgi:hypothetical protein
VLLEGLPPSGDALLRIEPVQRTREVRDPRVAERDQVFGGETGSEPVLDRDRVCGGAARRIHCDSSARPMLSTLIVVRLAVLK